jgi:hypothetical protein
MLKQLLCYSVIIMTALHCSSRTAEAGNAEFAEVKDDKCVVLHDKELRALPATWHKYEGFVKSCGLQNKSSRPKVSLISVWSHDYLDANNKKSWEEFPLPILVDGQFRQCGTLPELYPTSYVNSVYVSYGKWRSGIPTEIRVDVDDPTVSGDYHYAPLKWDDSDGKYKTLNSSRINGKRRR